ncbi:MAG: ImmA/IrrE family metallo-endopeptidase, partial [Myxococcota bacterium]
IINKTEIEERQRFTEAHELMELLFSQLPGGNGWAARDDGKFKRGKKEALCNRGAAELLMPRSSFLPRVMERGISISTSDRLAVEYEVSPTAAMVNMARVGSGEHTVVLWQHRHKPSELKKMSSGDQPSLYGGGVGAAPPKRLRVAWSLGKEGVPYVPPHKSVEESSSIYRAWESRLDNEGVDHLKLGPLSGRCTCENHTEEVEGQQVVLTLLHLPGDRDCSRAP